MSTPEPRAATPEPVLKAAGTWGLLAPVLVAAIGGLVAVGWLSAEQADPLYSSVEYINANIVPIGTALVSGVAILAGGAGSLATALVGRRKVTPVAEAPVRTLQTEHPEGTTSTQRITR